MRFDQQPTRLELRASIIDQTQTLIRHKEISEMMDGCTNPKSPDWRIFLMDALSQDSEKMVFDIVDWQRERVVVV